ncbi:MAG: ABC transporter substrate binding protein [Sulfuricella sp.]
MPKARSRLLLALFLTLVLAWTSVVAAAPANIAIVLSDDSAPYQETANNIRALVDQGPGRAVVSVYSPAGKKPDFGREHHDLIVAVGVRATQEMMAMNLTTPILATLIPRQAFEKIARQRDYRQFSAVYLDQPLARQMELIHLTLPERNRIGVVLGPESLDTLKALQSAAKEARFALVVEKIGADEELLPALQRVLAESDVLLALPDPLVFNRGTVQSLLLTTYRYQDPVIGFSQAYVKAGALAAVYTTPEQAGRQAGEVLLRVLAGKAWVLPPPEYPKYFSVSLNYQVARSLAINVGDETALFQKLKRTADQE